MTSPNVQTAKEERDALTKRYTDAYQKARQRQIEKKLREFEQAVQRSYATINVKFQVLYNLARDESYQNYYQRLKKLPEKYDEDRELVEIKLFQQARYQIRYAALTLDGTGLTEYGEFCLYLNEEFIQNRTSLLEENSFNFFKRHPIQPKTPMLSGYRAIWQNRGQLAVAKLNKKIHPTMNHDEFAKLLLNDRGDKDLDEFIEVHIYGKIDFQMVTKVCTADDLIRTLKKTINWVNRNKEFSPEKKAKLRELLSTTVKQRLGEKWQHYSQ